MNLVIRERVRLGQGGAYFEAREEWTFSVRPPGERKPAEQDSQFPRMLTHA